MKGKLFWSLVVIALVSLLIGHSMAASPQPQKPTKGAPVMLEVLNPRGEIVPPPTLAPAPRVTDLAGKKIGIYWNGKQGGNNFWDVAEELLREKFPTATILRYKGPFDLGAKLAGTLAKEVDTFIYGVGD
jgi:hypothetical protein